jgi:hypothetical protein
MYTYIYIYIYVCVCVCVCVCFVLIWGSITTFFCSLLTSRVSQSRKFESHCVIQYTEHRTWRLTCQLRCSPCLVGPLGQLGP